MDKPDETDNLMKPVMTMMIVIIMLAVVASILPTPPTPPTPQYTCPICGEKFFTYDELYSHFTTEHPAIDIDIIWE